MSCNVLQCLAICWNVLQCLVMPCNAVKCLSISWNVFHCFHSIQNSSRSALTALRNIFYSIQSLTQYSHSSHFSEIFLFPAKQHIWDNFSTLKMNNNNNNEATLKTLNTTYSRSKRNISTSIWSKDFILRYSILLEAAALIVRPILIEAALRIY